MNRLEECRKEIDEIDTEIIRLYEKRMDIVKDVIKYKIQNDIQVLDSNRESKMLENNLKKIKNVSYKKYYEKILSGFLTASKEMQKDILDKMDIIKN